MTKRYEIAVVGEIFNDHVFTGFAQWPKPGEEVFADAYTREIGGGAGITACALARLGRKVALVCVLGKEDTWSRARLQGFGIAMEGVKASAQETAVTVSVSTCEDRSFFTWAGANRELPAHLADPEVLSILTASRHIHFAMRLETELAEILLPRLRDAGCTLSIDPGFHPDWYCARENQETLGECDYFFPNEKEGELITGTDKPVEMMERLNKSGISGAVLKLGRRGAASIVDTKLVRAVPPAMQAVDTTGAGDAFDAGFLDSILDGASLEQAMRCGCACGALSTRAAGGIAALPGRNELEIMLQHVAMGEADGKEL